MEFCSDSLWPNKKNAAAFPKIPISHVSEEGTVSLSLQQHFIYNKNTQSIKNHRITMI